MKIYQDGISPFITMFRLTSRDTEIFQELAWLQDRVFKRRRHNRVSELREIVSSPETSAIFPACHGRRVSGFVHVRRSRREGEWFIGGIGIDRRYRRLGIAASLLAMGVKFVNAAGGKRLISYVSRNNVPSLMLHDKMGFRIDEDSRFVVTKLRRRLVIGMKLTM